MLQFEILIYKRGLSMKPFPMTLIHLIIFAMITACSTSPTGRRQLTLLPEEQMSSLGEQAFQQMKSEVPIENDPSTNAYVKCIVDDLVKNVERSETNPNWEVVVFKSEDVNAFALPGGKIGVYTGLLNVAKTPDQVAAVIGHEIGHVIANHSNARVSESLAARTGLEAVSAILGQKGTNYDLIMAGLGLGAQYGVLMPHSRAQETEADLIGLQLMAKSGFNPRASVDLWQNMSQAGGAQPPEFLSTHPSHSTRIETLRENMDNALRVAQNSAGASCQSKAAARR